VTDALLILNAGSSSLKFSVFAARDNPELVLRGQIEALASSPRFRAFGPGGDPVAEKAWGSGSTLPHAEAVQFLLSWGKSEGLREHTLVAAGHRVVHGGPNFGHPVRVGNEVMAQLEALVPLAPLHQPHSVRAIKAVAELAPGLPQVACFDTAFHRTQPAIAQMFAIPRAYTDAGVRRYGFHGLSYEYVASTLPALDATAATGRTIVAHLGNGASLCALHAGRSVATTMGLSALDGLVMGTRCGSIDPGVLVYLARHDGMSMDEIQRTLHERSGLLGVSGISGDMRTLLASDEPRAREALDLFVYRAAREIGSLAAALGGLDSIVFTGGIGENAAPIRSAICKASHWLGVELDEHANTSGGPCISRSGSRVSAWVIRTNEELMIARHTIDVLRGTSS